MQYEYTLRYKGRLKTPLEYENILIKSNTSGQTLRLGEIAKVELGGLQYNVNYPLGILYCVAVFGGDILCRYLIGLCY